jgi:hypothetical protein
MVSPAEPSECPICGKETESPSPQDRKRRISGCAIAVFLALLLPILAIGIEVINSQIREHRNARSRNCRGRLKQLAIALHCYIERYGTFPPAYVCDKNGRPMHSWRALLLPFLDVPQDVAAKYNFDEPWDSLNNRKITDVVVAHFKCPFERMPDEPTTSYMMVVGPHTISDGPHSRKVSEITDGASNTIMLVEVTDSGVRWAEPRDLSFDDIHFRANAADRMGIATHDSPGVFVAFCDARTEYLPNITPLEQLKAMLTIDGGEKIPKD